MTQFLSAADVRSNPCMPWVANARPPRTPPSSQCATTIASTSLPRRTSVNSTHFTRCVSAPSDLTSSTGVQVFWYVMRVGEGVLRMGGSGRTVSASLDCN